MRCRLISGYESSFGALEDPVRGGPAAARKLLGEGPDEEEALPDRHWKMVGDADTREESGAVGDVRCDHLNGGNGAAPTGDPPTVGGRTKNA